MKKYIKKKTFRKIHIGHLEKYIYDMKKNT